MMTRELPPELLLSAISRKLTEEDDWVDLGVCVFTPAIAAERLANLPADNVRRMTPYRDRMRTERYTRAMLRGRWQVNPGSRILLGKDDVLLDGKGRMQAVLNSGVTIRSYVSKSDTRTSAADLVIDQAVPRDAAYVLQRPASLVRAGALGFFILKNRAADHAELDPFCDRFHSIFERLGIDTRRNSMSTTAGVVLAALLVVVAGYTSVAYMEEVLALIARRDPKALPPLPYSFYRQVNAQRIHSRIMLIRAFRAFDEERSNITKLQVKSEQNAIEEIRHLLRLAVEEWAE